MKTILSIVIVFLVVILFATGYWYWGKIQDRVVAYNDSMITLLDYEENLHEAVVNHLNQYYAGEAVDIEKMREALNTFDAAHRDIITGTGQITVPDYETCDAFHTAFVNFLDNGIGVIAAYDAIVDHIASHNSVPETDVKEIEVTLNNLLKKDEKLFTDITDAQILMAKEFKFDLE